MSEEDLKACIVEAFGEAYLPIDSEDNTDFSVPSGMRRTTGSMVDMAIGGMQNQLTRMSRQSFGGGGPVGRPAGSGLSMTIGITAMAKSLASKVRVREVTSEHGLP